jgi:hypothetical protein
MPQSSGPRAEAHLSDSVHQHLNMYALAANAAGVGILALASPAHAKIVYTPSNIPITPNAGVVKLDLNNDRISDFRFSNRFNGSSSRNFSGVLTVAPAQRRNRTWAVGNNWSHRTLCAAAVPYGSTIGPQDPFQPGHSQLDMAWAWSNPSRGGNYGCPWYYVLPGNEAYLGLKFRIKGKVHFGWARVKMTDWMDSKPTDYITGYAYETKKSKPIIAGKTSGKNVVTVHSASLGHLARGASAMDTRRQKESTGANQ